MEAQATLVVAYREAGVENGSHFAVGAANLELELLDFTVAFELLDLGPAALRIDDQVPGPHAR